MHAEGARHRGVVGELEPGAHHLAVGHGLVVDLDLPDPGPFGCIGIGVPYGIAASLACPDRPVLVATGDGVWSWTSICQAPLLATTISTGALWRTAVSTSMALKPKAPSPVATSTGRSGQARLAAMP
jgi:acetolactate synthase-1/2/3 large subunit